MPFDGIDFQKDERQPDRAAPGEKVFSVLLLTLAFSLLVMPVSVAGIIDLARYIWGR